MSESPPSKEAQALLSGEAWRAWCDRLKATGDQIIADGFPEDPRQRAEGFRWLTRLMVHAVKMEMEAGDALHPFFVRYETPDNQWGGPNPDNTYLRANIDPNETYRVWADVRGMRQAIFSLNEGEMQLGEYGVYSEQTLDELTVDEDGRLEMWISPKKQPRNWFATDPKARLFTIRIYQSDWVADAAPVFHIERVGAEGVPAPYPTPESVARGLERSARWIEGTATYWNRYTENGWKAATPNQAAAPRSTPGGADNILYGSCFWQLDPDQALLIESEPPDAQYWGFTIHTMGWLESGHFADRQTSLSGDQVHTDGDGRVRLVLAHRDPGCANWIDTEERPRGLFVYRWVWSKNNPVPSSLLLPVADVRKHLPEDHPVVDVKQRRALLSERREQAWNRFQ